MPALAKSPTPPSDAHWLDTISAHALDAEAATVNALLARTGDITMADAAIRHRQPPS